MLLPDGCRLEASGKGRSSGPERTAGQPQASGEADERVRCMRMLTLRCTRSGRTWLNFGNYNGFMPDKHVFRP
jgi:hypothetical protein